MKVGQLKLILEKAGFSILPKKEHNHHSYWLHPILSKLIVLSGEDSKYAKPYQEKDIMASIKELEQLEEKD